MIKNIGEKLGPGLLYAATAVGVSHLVSSTQAGGQYGLIMAAFVVFVCLLKYPPFLFGARYAAATGETLVDGYARLGKWILYAIFCIHLFGFTIAIAGVSATTAALVKNILQLQAADTHIALALIIGCLLFLAVGRYGALEKISKLLVLVLSFVTALAAIIAIVGTDVGDADLSGSVELNTETILFLIMIAGWMPTGMAGGVSVSVWVKAKSERLGRRIPIKEAEFDFNLGYFIAIFTAVCFVILGTLVMYTARIPLAENSAAFSSQLFSLFTETLGQGAYVVIAITASTAMISTLLALLDLLPRISSAIVQRIAPEPVEKIGVSKVYLTFIAVELVLVSLFLAYLYDDTFIRFMAMVTSMGFLVAPPVAFLNHKVMFGSWVPKEAQPKPYMRVWSWVTITSLSVITAVYIYLDLLPRLLN